MNITFVSGANSKYYNFLKGLIINVKRIQRRECIKNFKFVIYDLGLNEEEKEYLKKDKFIIYELFDYSKYPEHVSLEKYNGINCSYAWKPIIFHKVCEKYNGIVQWLDTMTVYYNFTNVINLVKENGIYTPISSDTIKKWTHKNCIEFMKANKYLELSPRAGGILTINYDLFWCKKLIDEWKDLSLIKECIIPEGSNRKNHRQDQSILSILFYKYIEEYKFENHPENISLKAHLRMSK